MNSKITNSLVCFADILGYISIIKNNKIDDCAQIIDNIITNVNKDTSERLLRLIKRDSLIADQVVKLINENIHYSVISDSIIIHFDFDNVGKGKELLIGISMFYLSFWANECFDQGIPIRGCIDYGSLYYKDNIYAGAVIADSYSLSNRMNFSGIIMTDKALEYLFELSKDDDINNELIKSTVVKYNVPMKDKDEVHNVFRWFNKDDYTQEIYQLVFNKFHAHNKDVNSQVIEKIRNTEKILRYFTYLDSLNDV